MTLTFESQNWSVVTRDIANLLANSGLSGSFRFRFWDTETERRGANIDVNAIGYVGDASPALFG